MMIFIAFYFYFLIQIIMATKWKDSDFIVNELKDKFNWVPSMVKKWTKNVKKKISDGSVVVMGKMKDITKNAWKTIKDWKDFVIDKCKILKTKLGNVQTKSWWKTDKQCVNSDEKTIIELMKANRELIDLTKKLIDKYEENTKFMKKLSKKLSTTKQKVKSEKK